MADDKRLVKRTADDLAEEAADCIEDNALGGEQLRAYLAAWLAECAASGDLDAMRTKTVRDILAARHTRALKGDRG